MLAFGPLLMSRYHALTVARVLRETATGVRILFELPSELAATFAYQPGQHLGLRAMIDGRDTRRSYSICAGLDAPRLEICARMAPHGLMSNYLGTGIKPGDILEVLPPSGEFCVPLDATHAKTYACFAAGSGITPIISNLRSILALEPGSRALLFYGNRTTASILLNEELQDLKDRYPQRFSLHHFLSGEAQAIDLYAGRLDGQKVQAICAAFIAPDEIDECLICGPLPLINEVSARLITLGVPKQHIRSERFGLPRKPSENTGDTAARAAAEDPVSVSIVMDGRTRSFSMRRDEPLLVAAERHGLQLPYSCRGGVCCTCRCKLQEGKVGMPTNYALESWELDAGFILACQAQPLTDRLLVTYDEK